MSDCFGMTLNLDCGSSSPSALDNPNLDNDMLRQIAREEMGRVAAPCNFHQATVFFNLIHIGATKKQKLMMLFMSHALVWLQLIAVLVFVYGIYNSTCSRNSDCYAGQFCSPLIFSSGNRLMCHPCVGDWSLLCSSDGSVVEGANSRVESGLILWKKSIWPEVSLPVKSLPLMCLACVVDTSFLSGREATLANVNKMNSSDLFILALCLSLITLSVGNEMRDIFLCAMSRLSDPELIAAAERRKLKGLKPLPLAILSLIPGACTTWKLHWHLVCIECIRHYAILPVLIMSVPMLIVVQGSGGVSICMNSISVLFVLEMDNLAYQYGIPEDARELMEEEGTVELNEHAKSWLTYTKHAHFLSVPIGIIATLALIYTDLTGPYHNQIIWMLVCSFSFWACGLIEVFLVTQNADISIRLKLLCFSVGKMVLGEVGIWIALCLTFPYFIPRFFTGNFW